MFSIIIVLDDIDNNYIVLYNNIYVYISRIIIILENIDNLLLFSLISEGALSIPPLHLRAHLYLGWMPCLISLLWSKCLVFWGVLCGCLRHSHPFLRALLVALSNACLGCVPCLIRNTLLNRAGLLLSTLSDECSLHAGCCCHLSNLLSHWLQRKAKGSKQAEAELHMPELASARDVALDPFHAIGKLLYNKRGEDGSEVRLHMKMLPSPQLPLSVGVGVCLSDKTGCVCLSLIL